MIENNRMGSLKNYVRRGDVLLCDLGFGEGSEQSGVRPCVVVQNNVGNKFSTTLIVATITSSTTKAKLPTHIAIDERCGVDKPSIVLCEQIRTIDKNRIVKFLGSVTRQVGEKIDNALITSMEIFKKGELDVRNEVIKLTTKESIIINMIDLNVSGGIVASLIDDYIKSEMVLENLCNINRLYISKYYTRSSVMEKIISEKMDNINIKSQLRVVV